MTIRRFQTALAVMITCVGLVGCSGGGGGFVEPEPSAGPAVEEGAEASPEGAIEEGGADAEAPPP